MGVVVTVVDGNVLERASVLVLGNNGVVLCGSVDSPRVDPVSDPVDSTVWAFVPIVVSLVKSFVAPILLEVSFRIVVSFIVVVGTVAYLVWWYFWCLWFGIVLCVVTVVSIVSLTFTIGVSSCTLFVNRVLFFRWWWNFLRLCGLSSSTSVLLPTTSFIFWRRGAFFCLEVVDNVVDVGSVVVVVSISVLSVTVTLNLDFSVVSVNEVLSSATWLCFTMERMVDAVGLSVVVWSCFLWWRFTWFFEGWWCDLCASSVFFDPSSGSRITWGRLVIKWRRMSWSEYHVIHTLYEIKHVSSMLTFKVSNCNLISLICCSISRLEIRHSLGSWYTVSEQFTPPCGRTEHFGGNVLFDSDCRAWVA